MDWGDLTPDEIAAVKRVWRRMRRRRLWQWVRDLFTGRP